MMRVLAPTYADPRIVVLPSPGRRRAIAEALIESAATRSRAASEAGNPANRIYRLTGRTSHGIDTTSRTRRSRRARRRAALPQSPANAAAPLADKQAPSFYRYKVGDVQVTVISDGVNTFPLGDSFVLNAKKEEVAAALEKAFMPKDKVSIQFGPLVINSGGKLIVLDTGNGPGAFARARAPSAISAPTWPPPASTRRQSTSW